MDRREFLTLTATGIVGLSLSSFPLPALAKGKNEKEYSLIILGDTHFDTNPADVYHANYLKNTENISKARVAEFARKEQNYRDEIEKLKEEIIELKQQIKNQSKFRNIRKNIRRQGGN